ncbi:immunoglobulin J chain [Pyxicephalus adspersus]|uniref:immunoglobulin J chain n=1 Tax=Pyxicephalus adspersus TaxID=30357 RepID=UPI003B5AA558
MDKCNVLSAALLLLFAVYVTGQYYGEPEHVLVNNKCKCIKVTSRFVPSKENPGEEILERNIRITVPLSSRMNISDPYSPIRTHFNYNLWDM